MVDGRRSDAWDRAASIIAKLHNTHVAKERDVIQIEDVHPYMVRRRQEKVIIKAPKKVQMAALKQMAGL